MEGSGRMTRSGRTLIFLTITAALTAAVPAGAETRKPAFTSAAAPDSDSRRPSPGDHRTYSREIAEAAARYAVPEGLIRAVIRAESGFDPRAVSDRGAQGLMQLMPETASILGVRDSFNPRENINAGVRHLRGLIERFGNNVRLAIAAYNAGERAVAAYGGIPPYPETREYVTRVLRFYSASTEWDQMPGSGIHQIVERDGTVVYTNITPSFRPSRLPIRTASSPRFR
jgi:soluble lytic murein transglycosylase-like protein